MTGISARSLHALTAGYLRYIRKEIVYFYLVSKIVLDDFWYFPNIFFRLLPRSVPSSGTSRNDSSGLLPTVLPRNFTEYVDQTSQVGLIRKGNLEQIPMYELSCSFPNTFLPSLTALTSSMLATSLWPMFFDRHFQRQPVFISWAYGASKFISEQPLPVHI